MNHLSIMKQSLCDYFSKIFCEDTNILEQVMKYLGSWNIKNFCISFKLEKLLSCEKLQFLL